MMNKTTFTKFLISSFLLLLVNFFAVNGYAEGTPTLSPNPANITGLLSAPDIVAGPYVNAAEDNRVKFLITNNATENLYFGFDARGYLNTGPNPRLGANVVFYRIYSSAAPAVVIQQGVWDPTLNSTGSIDTHAEALAGPNINGVTTGYTPFVFNPTADGEYFISIYRSSTADGNTPITTGGGSRVFLPLFDFTVASGPAATATTINGRLYSDKWSFAAADAAFVVTAGVSPANAEPVFHAYTDDQTVVKIDFEPGFQPIAFNIAVNKYGVSTPGAWTTTRRSVNSAITPALTGGYKVFVNVPDTSPSAFPIAAIPANPTFQTPAISGCAPNYNINYNIAAAGDVQILLDLNGTPGFQAASADRILEDLDVTAGNHSLGWDGLNGLGVAVPSGTNFNIALTFLKGRFNLPLYDAELNKNGLRVSLVLPIPLANSRIYWDDSGLINVDNNFGVCDATVNGSSSNYTGSGLNNSFLGTISPAHAWSGNGNVGQTIPAPAVGTNESDGLQCSDFGNVRVINTWGWGYTSNATNLNVTLGCADLSVTKVASNMNPVVGSNVTFTLTATNNGTVNALNTIVNDLLSSSCYTFVSATPSTGSYNSTTGDWTIGTLNNGASATLNIVATVTSQSGCANSATITSNQTDTVPGNNTSSITPTPTNLIDAINDGSTTVASGPGIVNVGSVITNDTINGVPVTTVNTDVTPVTNGPLSINANGDLSLAPNTPSGTYTITYQLCETTAPANCDTAVATVVVANPIDAVDDAPVTLASGAAPVVALSVLPNDTLSGVAVTTTNTNVTPSTDGPLSIDANGDVTLAANTPSGTYTITYQLCEADPISGLNVVPANCDTAVATVIVANPIDAVNDPATTVASGPASTPAGSVLGNDTLNGVAVTTANTDVTPGSNGPLSVDVDGNLTVAPNTPSGTYTITYQLCETGAVPANCDTATATVIVANPIDAVDDPATTVASGPASTPAGSVLGNDTLNGVAVTTANTDVTPGSNGPLSVDVDGNLTVAPNTPSGTYTITYQLCETGSVPANCDTATATVIVANPIDAVDDPATTVASGPAPTPAGSVLGNDTLNGNPATIATTDVTPGSNGPLSVDVDGNLTVAPNTPSGTYTITYQLCETGAVPANCDTATATVDVVAPIDAVDDTPAPINGLNGGTTPSVLVNDTLNGSPVNPSDITLTPVTVPGGLTLNPDGTITVPPG
ncbi:MAG: DUF11 domain-containing protein, partial [Flavobacterium sp.]|nr:DUF11 domain-containing protein [Flavobacterium sp.]